MKKKEELCTLRDGFHALEQRDQIYLMQARACGRRRTCIAILALEPLNARHLEALSDVKPEEQGWRQVQDHGAAPLPVRVKIKHGEPVCVSSIALASNSDLVSSTFLLDDSEDVHEDIASEGDGYY
jgi:hypothetical protein